MPGLNPPAFGSQQYWNTRFTSNADPFEWLESPRALDDYIVDALKKSSEPRPRLLHIGCGTSLLSYHLRSFVQSPEQVHNIDYSEVAIALGKKREHELQERLIAENKNFLADTRYMRWDSADLLDHKFLLRACERSVYSVIVDKSTSDSISCADDLHIPLPYPLAVRSYAPTELKSTQSSALVHPLHIMAINLALIAKHGAHWIALSYSNDRFPFLTTQAALGLAEDLLPDACQLWRVIHKRELEAAVEHHGKETTSSVTHTPKICNWVYILERTNVPLLVHGEHL